jgi:hypothetical protein
MIAYVLTGCFEAKSFLPFSFCRTRINAVLCISLNIFVIHEYVSSAAVVFHILRWVSGTSCSFMFSLVSVRRWMVGWMLQCHTRNKDNTSWFCHLSSVYWTGHCSLCNRPVDAGSVVVHKCCQQFLSFLNFISLEFQYLSSFCYLWVVHQTYVLDISFGFSQVVLRVSM